MNITPISTHPKFRTGMRLRMIEQEKKQAHADSLRDTMIDVIRMDRELDEKVAEVAPIAERLNDGFHEMFPDGDCA